MFCKAGPLFNIPVRVGKKTLEIFTIYPAPVGSAAGHYRVSRREKGKEAWVRDHTGKVALLDWGAVGVLVAEAGARVAGDVFQAFDPCMPPDLPKRTRVRTRIRGPLVAEGADPDKYPEAVEGASVGLGLTWTASVPFYDGRQWFVMVDCCPKPVRCADVEVVR